MSPVPQDQRFKFFVYVIESPSAPDLYHRRSESDLIQQAVGLNGIPFVSRLAISREAFYAAVKVGLSEAMKGQTSLAPILHISAHGNVDGVQLSNGEIISWPELRTLLTPVNQAIGGALVICMSCCQGYSGIRMAMFTEESTLPFFALVGSGTSPTWPETAIAFATFYHLMARGEYIQDAVAAMRTASGVPEFFVATAEEQRRNFLEFLKTALPSGAPNQLEQQNNRVPPGELAKMTALEKGDRAGA